MKACLQTVLHDSHNIDCTYLAHLDPLILGDVKEDSQGKSHVIGLAPDKWVEVAFLSEVHVSSNGPENLLSSFKN